MCAAVIATVSVGAAKPASDLTSLYGKPISLSEMEAAMTGIMEKAGVTGLSCAIINGSKLAYCKTFGLKNRKTGEPNNEQTVFASASLSKTVFAYLVMLLVEDGVIELDKPLQKFLNKPLPDYKNYADLRGDHRYKQITARLCLTHSTGLAQRGKKMMFLFNPGQRYKYSGAGINLLQMVVEEVTGKGIEELAHDKVFEPLGMTRTSYVWQDVWKENAATPHDQYERPRKIFEMREAIAAGSMCTTAGDYARLLVAIIGAEGKRKAIMDEMLRSQVAISSQSWFSSEQTDEYEPIHLSWCLGWVRFDTKHGRAFFHIGRLGGCQNYVVTYADKGIGVVFMSNSDNFESVARELAEAAIGDIYSPFDWCGYPYYDPNNQKESPLHLAAYFGQKDIVELLIDKGADINTKNNNGSTPLHLAARFGQKDVVELLLTKGADFKVQNNDSRTAIRLAKENGHPEVFELLLKHANQSGDSKEIMTFYDYAAVGDIEQVKSFVSKGMDVNAKTQAGTTPLHFAVSNGRRDIAEYLISKGADINTKNNNGQTPLHLALRFGQKDVIELLIAKGADVNAKTKRGRTPLRLAESRGDTEIVELLRKHGAKE